MLPKLEGLDPVFVERRNAAVRKFVVDEITAVKTRALEERDEKRKGYSSPWVTYSQRNEYVWIHTEMFGGEVLEVEITSGTFDKSVYANVRFLPFYDFLTAVDTLVASVLKGERDNDLSKGGNFLAYQLMRPYERR